MQVYNNPKYYEIAFSFRDITKEVDWRGTSFSLKGGRLRLLLHYLHYRQKIQLQMKL